ncbi:MAG: Fe-Mn family superoxide dismutase [Burkholderiales bacterium]|nr:Fe-Mn family superoxide dismutase [Burkholderiales bacterium]
MALTANFGSVASWREEFIAMGRALGGGSGWVLLSFQPREGTLVNQWSADHTHALAGGVPLLALDMYEHAYHLDHGAAAAAYVDAFMANIDWAGVYARYQAAVHAASTPLARRSAPRPMSWPHDPPARRSSTCAGPACSSRRRRCCTARAGSTRPLSCRAATRRRPSPASRWSSTASTATKSAAPRRCSCAPPASTRASSSAASTVGRRPGAR